MSVAVVCAVRSLVQGGAQAAAAAAADRLTGCHAAAESEPSYTCLSRGIETRQPFACDMGGWSVCECPADTPYCPIVAMLKALGANTRLREADICPD